MKTWVLFFLFFILSTAIAIMMDLLMGMKLSMSLRNMMNPFWVMTLAEYVILFVLLSLLLFPPLVSFFRQRKQAQAREKS